MKFENHSSIVWSFCPSSLSPNFSFLGLWNVVLSWLFCLETVKESQDLPQASHTKGEWEGRGIGDITFPQACKSTTWVMEIRRIAGQKGSETPSQPTS
jgi:hypothetical protein